MGKRKLLKIGDVLKTNPFEGFWGCAVVLTEREKTEEFAPMCHIGITSVVFKHDYSFDELCPKNLKIANFIQYRRVAPNDYKFDKEFQCISIYARSYTPYVNVIGNINVNLIETPSLDFKVGDGTNGGWPLSGKVDQHLGNYAVINWRKNNEPKQWEKESREHRQKTEVLFEKMKIEAREKRKNYKRKT